MTHSGYYQRLGAYVAAAMLTQYIGDAEALRTADTIGMSIFWAKVILAGVITYRAFIDESKVEYLSAKKDDPKTP